MVKHLKIWTIYKQPRDFPDHFVVRLFENDRPTNYFKLADSLTAARLEVPAGTVRIDRFDGDAPAIVECWI